MQSVSRFENCVQTLSQTVASYDAQITNIEQMVSSLAARVTTLETNATSVSSGSGSARSWDTPGHSDGSTATGSLMALDHLMTARIHAEDLTRFSSLNKHEVRSQTTSHLKRDSDTMYHGELRSYRDSRLVNEFFLRGSPCEQWISKWIIIGKNPKCQHSTKPVRIHC